MTLQDGAAADYRTANSQDDSENAAVAAAVVLLGAQLYRRGGPQRNSGPASGVPPGGPGGGTITGPSPHPPWLPVAPNPVGGPKAPLALVLLGSGSQY